jgi:hypothetical protein
MNAGMEQASQLREAGLKRESGFGVAFSGGENPRAMTFNHGATNQLVNLLSKLFWCMRSLEGRDYWSSGVYREIVVLERIVYTDFFSDAEGNESVKTHGGQEFHNRPFLTPNFLDFPCSLS